MYEIRWKSSDRLRSKSKPPKTSTSGARKEKSHTHHHLSAGKIAAISVCVPLACLAIIGLAALLFRRRMRHSRESAQVTFTAARQSTLPEVYDAPTEETKLPERSEELGSPVLEPEQPTSFALIEASPLYEAEDTSPTGKKTGD